MKTKVSNIAEAELDVSTIDLNTTLAERIKKRSSMQQASRSLLPEAGSEQSMLGLSTSDPASEEKPQQRKRRGTTSHLQKSSASSAKKRTPSKLQSATIDKFLKPADTSTAVSSPTRFLRSKVSDPEEEDEDGAPVQEEEDETRGALDSEANSSSMETPVDTDSEPQRGGRSPRKKPVSNAAKKSARTKSVRSQRREESARVQSTGLSAERHAEASSSDDTRRRAVESSSGLDSESSLADQEFIHNQTKLVATPFTLEAGPGDWLEAWRKKVRPEFDEDDLPKHVIARAISKLNGSMETLVRKKLSRARQREALKRLVQARASERRQGASVQAQLSDMDNRLMVDPNSVLSHFPETWTETSNTETDTDDQSDDIYNRYSELRSHVHEMMAEMSDDKRQLQDNQLLLQSLESLTHMEPPDSGELAAELERSKRLVTEVAKKLKQKKYKRTSPFKSTKLPSGPTPLPNLHTELTTMLFDTQS